MNNNLFSAQAATIAISATATASTPVALPFSANGVRIVNEGPNVAFIAIAPTSTVATLPGASQAQTCTPVLAGSDITLSMAQGTDSNFISAICRASGTAVLSVSIGEGM